MGIIQDKAEKFKREIDTKHRIEGLILPTLIHPPLGRPDLQTGNYENCAIWTGLDVPARSMEYYITKDPKTRTSAKWGLNALHKLQDITGVSGLISRGFKIRDAASWDEDFFWIKPTDKTRQSNEWHQNGKYRWLGDVSKSQIFGIVFGYWTFNEFCNPNEEERKQISTHLEQMTEKLMGDRLVLKDADGQKSGYGDYRRKTVHLGIGGLGPSLVLGQLKLTEHITGNKKWGDEYRRLIQEEGFSECLNFQGRQLPPFKNIPILGNLSTSFGSEDNLAMLNAYMLLNLEQNPHIRTIILRGLENRWSTADDKENSLFNFIYHASGLSMTPDLLTAVDALKRFPEEKTIPIVALKRKASLVQIAKSIGSDNIPIENRPIDEYAWRVNPKRRDSWRGIGGQMEFTGVDYLLARAIGLKHGYLKLDD